MTQNQDGNTSQNQGQQMEDTGSGQGQPGAGSADNGQQRQFEQRSEQMGGGGAEQGDDSRFADQIREHMQVIDADGNEVGMVDSCEDGRIKLTRKDSADGQHHYLQLNEVEAVEGDQVRLRFSGSNANDAGFGQGV